MAAALKMDELLVSWLGSDTVYENVMDLMENYRAAEASRHYHENVVSQLKDRAAAENDTANKDESSESSPRGVIPPFYPKPDGEADDPTRRRRRARAPEHDRWDPLPGENEGVNDGADSVAEAVGRCARDLAQSIYNELGQDPPLTSPTSVNSEDDNDMIVDRKYLTPEAFVRITKEVRRLPSFFNLPLFERILTLWNSFQREQSPMEVITYKMLEWYWRQEMEPYDISDRFFRLVKQPENDFIIRDDFLPFIKTLSIPTVNGLLSLLDSILQSSKLGNNHARIAPCPTFAFGSFGSNLDGQQIIFVCGI